MYKFLVSILLTLVSVLTIAQPINHWETAVYNNDTWHYQPGNPNIPTTWKNPDFNTNQWSTGTGGFGYGDGDDNTTIPQSTSVFIRINFELIDTSVINYGMLHADYDDAFVAYLNGVEIARRNIGTVNISPPFSQTASGFHEAELYQGGTPENFLFSGTNFKSLIVEGNNTLAVQVHNQDMTSSDMTSNFWLSLGIADNSNNYGPTPTWFNNPFFESNLPLLIINTTNTAEIFDEPRVQAHMGVIDNGPGQTNSLFDDFNGYDGFISIESRGESSQMFPKKNYGFETQFENGENNNVELLGMPEENDWIIHGPYSDKTLLRNVLAYHMGEATGRYTPRTRLCEVFINEDYRGVYILTEKIKRDANRLDISTIQPEDIAGDELSGGYLFQIDRDNGAGWYSQNPNFNFYQFDDPDIDELLPIQRQYLQNFMNDFEEVMDSPNYMANYDNYVNVDSWIDYFLVTEIGKHIDAFKFSFYMHKTKDSNGGKLNFGPLWDFNLAFGNFDFGCSPDPPGWSYEFEGTCHEAIPFWVQKLVDIPEVQNKMDCRWTELRAGALHTDSLMQFINDKVIEIGNAQQRNFERWPTLGTYVWPNDFIGNSYESEVNHLKNWLTQRLQWMDLVMFGNCSLSTDNQDITANLDIKVFPNPATNQITIDLQNTIPSPKLTIKVYDLLGKFIQSTKLSNNTNTIDISNFKNSIYLYQIIDENAVISKGKLVKIK